MTVAAVSARCSFALAYAARGWPVLPTGRDKRPSGGYGLSFATTDETAIREWWARWPDAEPAVACRAAGLVVVDVDDLNAWDAFAGGSPSGASLVASTPRGGRHFVYAADERGEVSSKTAWRTGIDTKAGGGEFGGYIVLPSGEPDREWLDSDPFEVAQLAPPPEWLADLLPRVVVAPPPTSSTTTPAPSSEPSRSEWADLARGAGEGARNASLARLVGHWLGHGLAVDEVRALAEGWASRCSPALPLDEARRVVESVAKGDRARHPERHAAGESAPFDPKSRRAITVADVVAEWRKAGPLRHEPTGLASFDAATGGGPPFGCRIALVGPPDVSKTLAEHGICRAYASRGIYCGILAADEEAGDLVTRQAQSIGIDRAVVEQRDERTLARIEQQLAPLPIVYYDATWTIDDAADDLARHVRESGARGGAFFVDSLQTVRCNRESDRTTRAEVLGERMAALRAAATRHGLIVWTTSEANRASYVSRNGSERPADIAAGKGSSDIEYGARVVVNLRSLGDDVVEWRLVKNKLGRRTAEGERGICVRLDLARQTMHEVDPPPAEVDTDREDGANDRDVARVVAALLELGTAPSKGAIVAAAQMKRGRGVAVVDLAVARGLIVETGTSRTKCFRVAASAGGVCAALPHTPGNAGTPRVHRGEREERERERERQPEQPEQPVGGGE